MPPGDSMEKGKGYDGMIGYAEVVKIVDGGLGFFILILFYFPFLFVFIFIFYF